MFRRVLSCSATLVVILVSVCILNYFHFRSYAANSAAEAKHGLTGNYYVGSGGWYKDTLPATGGFLQIWTDQNDFSLPRTFTAPATTRVDAQVAFGQGKGFNAKSDGPPVVWWPTGFALPPGWTNPNDKPWDQLAAVIWKGYIHLPKAGTYYFGTVSHGASAVYLNQARVALNGGFGGVLVSDAFAYAKENLQDYVTKLDPAYKFEARPRDTYVVPVSIDAPRDLPIEIRYNWASHGVNWRYPPRAIDLFWVTPDSPRDPSGKPIASIVPGDALYTEPPSPIEKPLVRSANSTISADFLYFYFPSDKFVTVTVRLAEKDGNPVPGKHVYLNSLNEWKADPVIQPDKPTDADGITTAKIRADVAYQHDSAIFAADVTDFVDVAQVAHVSFLPYVNSFFPQSFSPYYDPKGFTVEPLPMRIGQPLTIKVALENGSSQPGELTATFKRNDWNIGTSVWKDIGQVKNIHLNPHEHKDISIRWTPQEASEHQCFRVELNGHFTAARLGLSYPLAAAVVPALLGDGSLFSEVRQHNIGAVSNCKPAGQALYTLLGGGLADFCYAQGPCPVPGSWPVYDLRAIGTDNKVKGRGEPYERGDRLQYVPVSCSGPGGELRLPNKTRPLNLPAGNSPPEAPPNPTDNQPLPTDEGPEVPIPNPPIDAGKDTAARAMSGLAANCDGFLILAQQANRAGNEAEYKAWIRTYQDCQRERGSWDGVVQDPPDKAYHRLAVASSDTPVGYIDAVRVSMERYRAAQDEDDIAWIARHLTAMELYFKRLAEAERRAADDEEKRAAALPTDSAKSVEQSQSDLDALFARLHQPGGTGATSQDLRQLENLGITERQAKSFFDRLLTLTQPPMLQGPRGLLLQSIALRRDIAGRADTVAARSVAAGTESTPSVQTFDLGNPHDNPETVDLFVRPISIPPDWKLNIANAEQVAPQDQITGAKAPQYPVREIEPGKHYALTLPAKAQVKVASVLIPVGELGARTTARWAVEGKIGNELIGGMVHEMNVPYIIADLQLPPVGSKEVEEELPAPSKPWARITAGIAAGMVVLGLLVYFFLFWRRRRQAHSV